MYILLRGYPQTPQKCLRGWQEGGTQAVR